MIAGGASLGDILTGICNAIDAHDPSVMCTVLIMDSDGKQLWPAAGPRVPVEWTRLITPLPIGPDVGSCGAAAYLKEKVIVADIAHDPLFDRRGYREQALRNGLRAAWSVPLLSKPNEVLGTFAMYYGEPRKPTPRDVALVEAAAHLALIAIESDRTQAALKQALNDIQRAQAKLREDERELRRIVDAIPQTIVVLNPEGRAVYANRSTLEYTGLTLDEVMAPDFRTRIFHPDDVSRLANERQDALSRGEPFENEQRARRRDGAYRWFLVQYNPLHDEEGRVLHWYATGTDIDDRKRDELRVRSENLALREDIDSSSMFEEIVGSSAALKRVLADVARVARVESTVLITGETGTGKELIARAIHKRSARANRAFIRLNCAAIPPSLIASELFGHEKGAFTGATQRRVGRFEAADGGTILLDEVGELPPETQIALLRVLQEGEVERIGSSTPAVVDVRVLAATNRDLKAAVASGRFREDLYYRLNVFPVRVPPLRERLEDLPMLVEYLVQRYAAKLGRRFRHVSRPTLDLLRSYSWPGNVRELQNVIERAVVLSDGDIFSVDESWLTSESQRVATPAGSLGSTIADRERELIEAALTQSGGRIAGPLGAAAKLGIPRQTLDSKIASLGIDKLSFRSR
jgi:formate hydrogenlyase transcriptional activator